MKRTLTAGLILIFIIGSASVLVPTNYWDGWITDQRERDFTLDLSRFHIVLGVQVKF